MERDIRKLHIWILDLQKHVHTCKPDRYSASLVRHGCMKYTPILTPVCEIEYLKTC